MRRNKLDLSFLINYLIQIETLKQSFKSNEKMYLYLEGKSIAVREIIKEITGNYIKIKEGGHNVLQSIDVCKDDCKNN